MKKRKKKHKKSLFTSFLQILLVISGVIGWYFAKTWQGIITAIVIYFVVIICCTVWFKTRRLARLRRAGIKDVDNMTGEEFEQFLGQLFKRRGYKVSYTAASGDYGADLILKDRKEIIAVQAKRYSGTVGVKAVQEIIGAVKMYDATEAWVVTNSHFTKQAIKLADINDVYLIDREELIDLILKK
ncbi:restriction endonuclease [Metasolibacillus sp. FSL K6-0083]|uniref:restriction endonuclease n=1 Tax=Metasolibacillus sp. FSL K6-0083 TaxID=2921416 RepID=UPI00315A8229